MPRFFRRRRKREADAPQPASTSQPSQDEIISPANVPSTSNNTPLVDRRIHPDLNALAEELEMSSRTENSENVPASSQARHNLGRQSPSLEFLPLPPSARRNRNDAGTNTRTRIRASTSGSTPRPSSSSSVLPVSRSKRDWATFGRRSRSTTSTTVFSNASGIITSTPIKLRKPHSRATSRSSTYSVREDGPSDVRRFSSQSHLNFSPHSRSQSSQNLADRGSAPSPHTFGRPTPPSSRFAFRPPPDSPSFNFGEIPPPLPPLDHPAFRWDSGTFGRTSKLSSQNSSTRRRSNTTRHVPRHSRSLPALFPSRSNNTPNTTRSSTNRKHSTTKPRPRSQTSLRTQPPIQSSSGESKTSVNSFRNYSRRQSKSSNAASSSRRSSAEYSAKRASSIGHERGYEKSWEVQVANEMVRMSLSPSQSSNLSTSRSRRSVGSAANQDAAVSTFGRAEARGDNQSTGRAQALGFPFLLQDSLTDYLPDTLSDTSTSRADTSPRKRSHPGIRTIFDIMSQSNDDTTISRRDKGKGKEVVRPGSSSRRGSNTNPSTPSRTRTPPAPQLRPIPDFGPLVTEASSSLPVPTLQVVSPTPDISPISPTRRTHHKSSPAEPPSSVLRHASPPPVQKSHSSGSTGKRKADEVEGGGTPPKEQNREQKATFALGPRPHRASGTSSQAPSSYHRQKRARLSMTPETQPSSLPPSRSGSTVPQGDSPNVKNTGTWSSKASAQGSRAPSSSSHHPHRSPSRRSLSQVSIPISALVSPHAPSVSRSSQFHMRDPRRPAPIQSTPWSLSFPDRIERGEVRWAWRGWVERGGSPLHAWLFFIGFVFFPLWWAAALFIPIPRTRRLGADEAEKGVVLDDPQVEHDAKSWRTRCRVMAVVSLFTYIPFIVLVAIFAR